MCGIAGIINYSDTPVQEASIRKMMQLQKHRGPDDEGVFVEDNIGLGFVRLSILDLSPAGHQPLFSSDKRYVVAFNGEIFNYIELREELKTAGYKFVTGTDTEVLLAAYMHWGEDCLHHFNGMWAFVIYDREQKLIFGARDRFGIKPFYYYLTSDYFAFASEIPPLLSLIPGKATPDYQSIFDYLVFNRTDQTERTFFSEIKKLQHGHCFLLSTIADEKTNTNCFQANRWYNLREHVALSSGFKDPEELRALLSDSINLRLRSDVPVGVCLSGGLDSSAIVSILLKDYNKKDLNTFSAVYQKGQYGDETDFIMEFKPFLDQIHFITPDATTLTADLNQFIRAHGEPIPSTSPYAQFKVNELASKHVVVTIDGQGADEELAGYHYFFGFYFKDLLHKGSFIKLFSEIYNYLKLHKSVYGLKTFAYFLLPETMRTSARIGERGYLVPEFINRYKDENCIAGHLYGSGTLRDSLIDHFEFKLEHLLKWEDRNSMWFSIEARVPFLDFRFVEKVLATDSSKIIRKGWTKSILREAMKETMPEKIRMRRDKIGFGTPQDEWFRSDHWKKFVREILNSKRFAKRNIIDPCKANALHVRHCSGEMNLSKEIWKWVHLELWFREFID
jgi:asparagine synthase (glutamine-hydrolysing)